MNLFKGHRDAGHIHLRCMLESGVLVDDTNADVIQNQVISRKEPIALTNRAGTPLYYLTQEGQPAQLRDVILVETGFATAPDDSSAYMFESLPRFFRGVRSGAVGDNKQNWLTMGDNLPKLICGIATTLFVLGLLIIGSQLRESDDLAIQQHQQQAVQSESTGEIAEW